MASQFVVEDTDEDNVRWIAEPRLYRKARQLKGIWNAFKFLAHGGKFKEFLDFSGIDSRIISPVQVTISHDGQVVDVKGRYDNAVSSAQERLASLSGLILAGDDEPGFRVRWNDSARGDAWKDAGLGVAQAPGKFIVQPKGLSDRPGR
ncbi:hypothetical protein [Desulfocurvus sp. DL9XJH121]